jgi:4-amino-4-deoxy-L-arabinose transferase-like glycosyltransferase
LCSHSLAASLLLIAIASLRIVATYNVFSHTSDEPPHVACGLEWLDKGVYQYEAQHPPLARVAAALGPYLAGARSQGNSDFQAEGVSILSYNEKYDRNLALARLGILPFFWIAAVVVFFWAKRQFDGQTAVLAVFLFTFLPPVLAHAGLATTDMAVTAFVGAAFLAVLTWVNKPTLGNSAVFGACGALAVLSKFTALPFLPSAMALALIWSLAVEKPGFRRILASVLKLALPFCFAALVGAFVIWAGYRFSFGSVPFTRLPLPAPQLYAGITEAIEHNRSGHPAYLLGHRSQYGFWYYYPVILMFKSPLPFLALLLIGILPNGRRPHPDVRGVWLPLAFSLGILLFSLTSQINIGVRHVLSVYIGFSIVTASGAVRLLNWERKTRVAHWILGGLLLWSAATSLTSHPDYLAYFNALAGSEPERIAVDSDLDWGQDIKRLGKRLRELGASSVAFYPFFPVATHDLPLITTSYRDHPSPGWNAMGLTLLKTFRLGLYDLHPEIEVWPEQIRPTERVGKGMLLWYIPPQSQDQHQRKAAVP